MFKLASVILFSSFLSHSAFAGNSTASWDCTVRGADGTEVSFSAYGFDANTLTWQVRFTKIGNAADASTATYGPAIIYFPTFGKANPIYDYPLMIGTSKSYLPDFSVIQDSPLTLRIGDSSAKYVCQLGQTAVANVLRFHPEASGTCYQDPSCEGDAWGAADATQCGATGGSSFADDSGCVNL